MVAAGALIAQQVAGKATRDALFLSTFHVSSLPLVMIASALVSALAVLGFSAALAAPLAGAGGAAGPGRGHRAAARRVGPEPRAPAPGRGRRLPAHGRLRRHRGLRLLVAGQRALRPLHWRGGSWAASGSGASLGGVAGGLLAWSAAGVLPVPACSPSWPRFNVVCLLALGRLRAGAARRGADAPRPRTPGPLSGLRLAARGARTCATSPCSWPWAPPRRRCSTTS